MAPWPVPRHVRGGDRRRNLLRIPAPTGGLSEDRFRPGLDSTHRVTDDEPAGKAGVGGWNESRISRSGSLPEDRQKGTQLSNPPGPESSPDPQDPLRPQPGHDRQPSQQPYGNPQQVPPPPPQAPQPSPYGYPAYPYSYPYPHPYPQGTGYPPPPVPPNPYGSAPPYPGYPQPGLRPQDMYGHWGARVAALLLDSLITSLLPTVLFIFGYVEMVRALVAQAQSCDYPQEPTTTYCPIHAVYPASALVFFAIGGLLAIAGNLWLAYREGTTGFTPGKKALDIKLVRESTGEPIGFGLAFVRRLLGVVDSLPCYLGLLWPLWDVKRQTFSDKIMGTVVIKVR